MELEDYTDLLNHFTTSLPAARTQPHIIGTEVKLPADNYHELLVAASSDGGSAGDAAARVGDATRSVWQGP